MFSLSLFSFSQFVIFSNEVLTFASSLLIFLSAKERLVASTNRWRESSVSDLCISLSNGSRTLPCGTPHVWEHAQMYCLQFLHTGFYPNGNNSYVLEVIQAHRNTLILKVVCYGSVYRTPLQNLEKLNKPCLLFPALILCYITSQELHVQ